MEGHSDHGEPAETLIHPEKHGRNGFWAGQERPFERICRSRAKNALLSEARTFPTGVAEAGPYALLK